MKGSENIIIFNPNLFNYLSIHAIQKIDLEPDIYNIIYYTVIKY